MTRALLTLLAAQVTLGASLLPVPLGADLVPGKYIVALKEDASESVLSSVSERVQSTLGLDAPRFMYNMRRFKGFTLDSEEALLQQILSIDEIDFIEPESVFRTQAVQSNAPYGLARISHKTRGSTDYVYDDVAGAGTYSYIIDTGILTEHPDFGGRASFGANFAGDGNDTDGNGHGTHVAGTTGSNTYGVAKGTNLIAVKVLNAEGSGPSSGVIAGIEWAANDVVAKGRQGKSVANLSLGSLRIGEATNRAVRAATEEGLFMSVAAGNSNAPTILFSPASEPTACTVGAIDMDDARASFSNFGIELDTFAPGVDIISTWNDGKTMLLSGTSMSTPHVTGLGAYYLSLQSESPAALCQRIRDTSSPGVSGRGLLSPDRIAYNGAA